MRWSCILGRRLKTKRLWVQSLSAPFIEGNVSERTKNKSSQMKQTKKKHLFIKKFKVLFNTFNLIFLDLVSRLQLQIIFSSTGTRRPPRRATWATTAVLCTNTDRSFATETETPPERSPASRTDSTTSSQGETLGPGPKY